TTVWLVAVLNDADRNSWRAQVRQAWAAGEGATIEQRAGAVDVSRQPPSFLLWVAAVLPKAGPMRLALLRRIQQGYPADFWANHGLANELSVRGSPSEAVRYYTAALALRPRNPGVYLN